MTVWMAWTLAVSMLLAFSAMLITRVAFYFGVAHRFVWAFAMLAAVAAPLLLPPRPLSLPWRSYSKTASADTRVATPLVDAPTSDASSAAPTQTGIDWSAVSRRADPWIAGSWALWSGVLLISLARAVARLRRRRGAWKDVETEVGRVFVAQDDGPAVVGWLRPRIVIPTWALAEDSSTQALMLRHELEHLRAGDTRLLLLNEIVRRAFPWNAAVWWMADRLRLAVEMDCDARVVRASGAAHAYGIMLLAVSARLGGELPLAATQLVRGGDLERRLQVLGTERRRRPVVASVPYMAVALIVLTTAAWTPRPGFPARGRAVIAAVDSDLVRVGYEHRKQAAPPGFFIDGSQIDRSARLFSDAFRAVPGLLVSPSGDGRTNVIATADTNGCVQVYVDGAPWQAQTPGDVDDFVNPAKLIAVELYRPQDRPPQFARPNAPRCSALVVWTQAIRGRRLKR